ncbi:sprouty-related, EVH1 domain-containing protein 2-like [Antedon mediterranea]|uniref:sprouty-related, EVH1 domain-containing protein 2-like n=1 Tax=Antedon mediterranea TaxID=105859 RepID=UPI003AF6C13A
MATGSPTATNQVIGTKLSDDVFSVEPLLSPSHHSISTQPKSKLQVPPLPNKNKVRQERCVHCTNVFDPSQNKRGQCQYAPDSALHCIRQLTCYYVAETLQYHCCSGDDNEDAEVCSCDPGQDGCCKKWTALVSLCIPCLLCYLTLRGCHKVGVKCGICGSKHIPEF